MPEMPQEDINLLSAFRIVAEPHGGTPARLGATINTLTSDKLKLEGDLTEARAKIPAEGAVVLVGDEAKEHQDYKALGVKPSEAKMQLEELGTLRTRDQTRSLGDNLVAAATAEKWGDPRGAAAILARLEDGKGLVFENRPERVADVAGVVTTTDKWFVKPAGENQTAVPFGEYAATNYKEMLPVLTAAAGSGAATSASAAGAAYPAQAAAGAPAAGAGGAKTGVDAAIAANHAAAKAGNPLRPATKTT